MILFRIFGAFLTAEVTNIATHHKSAYSEYLNQVLLIKTNFKRIKVEIIKRWMTHIKCPDDLINRTAKFYQCLWNKFKGKDDFEILNKIPETIKNDISIHLLKEYLIYLFYLFFVYANYYLKNYFF